MPIENERCENCLYWLNAGVNPVCRRFPESIIHKASDWCGEFMALKGRASEPSEPEAARKQTEVSHETNPAKSESENAARTAAPSDTSILSPREQGIMDLKKGNFSFKKIGLKYGISAERARQIYIEAQKKLEGKS